MTTMQKNPQEKHDTVAQSSNDELIHLETVSEDVAQAKDINSKIDLLDGNLGALNAELETIKASVNEGLDRLGDNDLDLTSKVSDTYKRLAELDNTYKSLIDISSNINDEIQKLTGNVSQLATSSTAELDKIEAASAIHNRYAAQNNKAVANRVDRLVNDSHETSTRIQLNLKDVQEKIRLTEITLISRIESLADSTQQRDEILAKNLDAANFEIETNQAKFIKLQKIDEAIERRADSLEVTSKQLSEMTGTLDVSVSALGLRSDELSSAIKGLLNHTEALQKKTEIHQAKLAEIEMETALLAKKLDTHSGVTRNHFRMVAGFVLLMMFVGSGYYYTHEKSYDVIATQTLERNQNVDKEIVDINANVNRELLALNQKLSGEVESLNNKLTAVNSSVATLGKQTDKISDQARVLDEQAKLIADQAQKLDDQAQSLDGRLSAMSPMDNFGGDNIVHSSKWLSALPENKYIIRIATVTNKRELYEIAQRYNNYLTQKVAYYVDDSGAFVMVYGDFETDDVANKALRKMPSRINWQRPEVVPVSSVKKRMTL